jgi:hypothetical protein
MQARSAVGGAGDRRRHQCAGTVVQELLDEDGAPVARSAPASRRIAALAGLEGHVWSPVPVGVGSHQTARGRRSDAPPGRRVGREGDLERPSVESTPAGRVSGKIQAICNGKCVPITMQALVMAREKRATQEQWEAMKKQCEEQ